MSLVRADDADALRAAMHALDEGQLVLLPTEAGYHVAADALVDEAVDLLYDSLSRAADEGLTVGLSGIEDFQHAAFATPLARDLATRFWPGPLSLVLRARPFLPEALTAGQETVATWAPAHAFPRALARQFGPLALAKATPGLAPATAATAHAAVPAARLVVDDGELAGDAPSVVDATGTSARVMREGAFAASRLVG